MGGLFTSFGVGVSGLTTAQAALNATAHNITNVDTKGYTRQQILISDFLYHKVQTQGGEGKNQSGLGSLLQEIRQVRDKFLDATYRHECGRQGFYSAQRNASSEIEDLFGELEGSTFQKELQDVWTAIQEIQKEPESIVNRTNLIETADSFLKRSEDIYKQLVKYQNDLNRKVKESVDRINEIGKEIHQLNVKIVQYEAGPENANDYRDQRNKLIDELGKLANISTREYLDGTQVVSIEGSQFVTEFGYNEIQCTTLGDIAKRTGESVNADTTGLYIPTWKDGLEVFNTQTELSPARDNDIGYVKGLLLSRGRKTGRYTDIPIKPQIGDFRTTEKGTLSQKTDLLPANQARYESAMGAYNNLLETYNNDIAPSVIVNTQAEFDQLIHGVTTMLDDILSPNFTATFTGTVKLTDSQGNVAIAGDRDIHGIQIWRKPGTDLTQPLKDEDIAKGDTVGGQIVNVEATGGTMIWTDQDGNRLVNNKWLDSEGNDITDQVDMDGKKKAYLANITIADMNKLATAGYNESRHVFKTDFFNAKQRTGQVSFKVLNALEAPIGLDSAAEQGNTLFKRKSVERYSDAKANYTDKDGNAVTLDLKYTDTDGKEKNIRVYNNENKDDLYSMFTLNESEINITVKDKVAKLPISYKEKTGDYSAKTADRMAAIFTNEFATLNPGALTKNDFFGYYTALTGEVANTGNTFIKIEKSQETTVASVDERRQMVLGVNADEELTFLIKFQHTYNANSRYITVINDMLDTLINRMAP